MKKVLSVVLTLMVVFSAFVLCLGTTASATQEGYFTYEMTGGNAILTKVDPAISGDVVVPVHLGNFDILYIDEGAFKDCVNITSVTYPEEIDGIYFGAFEGCTNLKTVTFNCKAYSQKDSAGSKDRPVFANCPNLTTVNIGKNVTAIPKYLFYGVESITTVNFEGDMPKIGQDAFTGTAWQAAQDAPVSSTPAQNNSTVSKPSSNTENVSSKEDTVSSEEADTTVSNVSDNSSKPTTTKKKSNGGINTTIIIIIVVGGVLFLGLALTCVLLLKSSSKDEPKKDEAKTDAEEKSE